MDRLRRVRSSHESDALTHSQDYSSRSSSSSEERRRHPHRVTARRSHHSFGDEQDASRVALPTRLTRRRLRSGNVSAEEVSDTIASERMVARSHHHTSTETSTREFLLDVEWIGAPGTAVTKEDEEAGDGDANELLADNSLAPLWSQHQYIIERRVREAAESQAEDRRSHSVEEPLEGATTSSMNASRTTAAPSTLPRGRRSSSIIGFPTLAQSSAVLSSSLNLRPRMQEADTLPDPRTRLLNLLITNTSASITLPEMEEAMEWSTRYSAMYGPLKEYLQSFQSIFVVSPVGEQVRLRRLFSVRTTALTRHNRPPLQHGSPLMSPLSSRQGRGRLRAPARGVAQRSISAVDRRSGKPSLPSAEALAAHIGSVSYSCVAEHLDLDALEIVYHRRGYDTAVLYGVLHVASEGSFHLFIFSGGSVVWWGMDRKEHWMVEDDFLSATHHLQEGVEHRHLQSDLDALFPIWCSYEVDEQCGGMEVASVLGIRPAAVEPALERLAKVLCFDHYLVPANGAAARILVMLTFSHSLERSARLDYFEFVTKWSHRHIGSISAEFTGLLDYFSTKRRIAKLEGELAVAQLAIQSICDSPEVLWEVPWLQVYYDMAEQQNTAGSRLSWFTARSDTLLEQLSHIKGRRHRLFMLGSDVFLIVLLILDVIFMTSRLVAKMYFKVDEEAASGS